VVHCLGGSVRSRRTAELRDFADDVGAFMDAVGLDAAGGISVS
jgi:hypothetical protein